MDWRNCPVLVTGGASFIGSHLVDALVERGASVRVVDDLSSGQLANLGDHVTAGRVVFFQADLLERGVAAEAVRGARIVFHLAAIHGGRGYVQLHQADCSSNFALDGVLFRTCRDANVEKVVFASSGCVYPNYLQNDAETDVYLREDVVGPPYDADNMYGWAKLMGEMTLRSFCADYGMKAACCRYFTVYGPRGHENHAIMAMIARACIRQDPFEVWGDGKQLRNWTHVTDIVAGTILAAERIDDGSAINLGTTDRIRVAEAVAEILSYTGHTPRLKFLPEMPTGPVNRIADNSLARRLLGWAPRVSFSHGVRETIDWYVRAKDLVRVAAALNSHLTERRPLAVKD